MSPRMLCAFKNSTKTMVEMTAMSNTTGLVLDVIGGHGVVEYVNGIAPGVFVTVATDNEEIAYKCPTQHGLRSVLDALSLVSPVQP